MTVIEVVADDVFDQMGTQAEVREANRIVITNLIARFYADTESKLGRKIQATTATKTFYNGKGCLICGARLYFTNWMRDIISIVSLTEEGQALTQSTVYNDNNDYTINEDLGCLERTIGSWSWQPNAFTITGAFGLVGDDQLMLPDIKQYIVERVALKSGLWVKQFRNSDGSIDTYVKTEANSEVKDIIAKYIGSRNV